MINLADYFRTITMDCLGGSRSESCDLYIMDGRIPGVSGQMPRLNANVGFSAFPCCDFFVLKGGVISLIEAVQALNVDVTKECLYIPWDEFQRKLPSKDVRGIKSKLFRDHIVKRSLRKLLGSMVVLSRAALKCNDTALHTNDLPKYNFWLVIHLPPPKGRGMRNAKALDRWQKRIKKVLPKKLSVSKGVMLDVDVVIGGQLVNKMRSAGFA